MRLDHLPEVLYSHYQRSPLSTPHFPTSKWTLSKRRCRYSHDPNKVIPRWQRHQMHDPLRQTTEKDQFAFSVRQSGISSKSILFPPFSHFYSLLWNCTFQWMRWMATAQSMIVLYTGALSDRSSEYIMKTTQFNLYNVPKQVYSLASMVYNVSCSLLNSSG